jgi:hypothetical protein
MIRFGRRKIPGAMAEGSMKKGEGVITTRVERGVIIMKEMLTMIEVIRKEIKRVTTNTPTTTIKKATKTTKRKATKN